MMCVMWDEVMWNHGAVVIHVVWGGGDLRERVISLQAVVFLYVTCEVKLSWRTVVQKERGVVLVCHWEWIHYSY